MTDVLDNPVWAALTGPHRDRAESYGQALRYPPDVSPFTAVPDEPDDEAWADLAHLVGPRGAALRIGAKPPWPDSWTVEFSGVGVQLLATDHFETRPFDEAVPLGGADEDDMLDLTARTKPGPFLRRTHTMGNYVGVRREGRLVAMAGERLRPPGWTEISAVCTDPDFRGLGLGTRLVQAVGHGIRQRGEQPMMHASATNVSAIRLYQSLGFVTRCEVTFGVARAVTRSAVWHVAQRCLARQRPMTRVARAASTTSTVMVRNWLISRTRCIWVNSRSMRRKLPPVMRATAAAASVSVKSSASRVWPIWSQ
jgi:ribosomal protein S18 acetylase RimI-like enzyme